MDVKHDVSMDGWDRKHARGSTTRQSRKTSPIGLKENKKKNNHQHYTIRHQIRGSLQWDDSVSTPVSLSYSTVFVSRIIVEHGRI
jgi:hypothetical protein